jgi:hypothetical protein
MHLHSEEFVYNEDRRLVLSSISVSEILMFLTEWSVHCSFDAKIHYSALGDLKSKRDDFSRTIVTVKP